MLDCLVVQTLWSDFGGDNLGNLIEEVSKGRLNM